MGLVDLDQHMLGCRYQGRVLKIFNVVYVVIFERKDGDPSAAKGAKIMNMYYVNILTRKVEIYLIYVCILCFLNSFAKLNLLKNLFDKPQKCFNSHIV